MQIHFDENGYSDGLECKNCGYVSLTPKQLRYGGDIESVELQQLLESYATEKSDKIIMLIDVHETEALKNKIAEQSPNIEVVVRPLPVSDLILASAPNIVCERKGFIECQDGKWRHDLLWSLYQRDKYGRIRFYTQMTNLRTFKKLMWDNDTPTHTCVIVENWREAVKYGEEQGIDVWNIFWKIQFQFNHHLILTDSLDDTAFRVAKLAVASQKERAHSKPSIPKLYKRSDDEEFKKKCVLASVKHMGLTRAEQALIKSGQEGGGAISDVVAKDWAWFAENLKGVSPAMGREIIEQLQTPYKRKSGR